MKKAKMRRSLALLLALVMCFGLLPMGALAAQVEAYADGVLSEEMNLSVPISVTPYGDEVELTFDMVDSENLLVNGDFTLGKDGRGDGRGAWTTWSGDFDIVQDGDRTEVAKIDRKTSTGIHETDFWTEGVTPDAQYTYSSTARVDGDTGKEGTAWVTFETRGSGDKDVQYEHRYTTADTDYRTQVTTFRETGITAMRMTTWVDERSPEYLYLDSATLTKKVVTEDGNQYFYSDERTDQTSAAPEVGVERPADYSHVLVSGDKLARTGGEYVNVVEVDSSNKVVAFAALEVSGEVVIKNRQRHGLQRFRRGESEQCAGSCPESGGLYALVYLQPPGGAD